MKKLSIFTIALITVLAFGYNLFAQDLGATILYPSGGGTGTSTNPAFGNVLMGNGNGTYDVVSTSTLGITAGGGSGIVTSIATTFPILGGTITETGTLTFGGLSTSTDAVIGNIPYFTSANEFANVATTSLTATAPIVFSQPMSVIGDTASVATCNAASGLQAGCLSAANWATFNNKWDLASTTIGVAYGGTGAVSLDDGFILLGSGTGAITPLDVTALGSILVGDGATDPIALALGTPGELLGVTGGTVGYISTSTIPVAGEAGGTLGAITIDAIHSGSAHHSILTISDTTTIDLSLTDQLLSVDSLLTFDDFLTLTGASVDVDTGAITNGATTVLATAGAIYDAINTASSTMIGNTNITTLGTIGTGAWEADVISLTYGGSNKNLTASNGGIVYTDADSMEVLAGTATAGQILRSGSSVAPSWSTATFASTYADQDLLYSNGANVVAGLTKGSNGDVLITNYSGNLEYVATSTLGLDSGGGGATTALDNLASVQINTSLLSDTADTDSLGTTNAEWANLYIGDTGKVYFGIGQDGSIHRNAANELTITATAGITTSNNLKVSDELVVNDSILLDGSSSILSVTNQLSNSSSNSKFLLDDNSTTLTTNYSGALMFISGSWSEGSSGNHNLISSLAVNVPTINVGGSTVTNTATVYIEGSATTTNASDANYSLWVDDVGGGGKSLINGEFYLGTTTAGVLNIDTNGLVYSASASSGANVNLSNIESVAIPVDLSSDTQDTNSLGSTAKEWLNAYIGDAGKLYFGLGQDASIERSAANELTLTASSGVTVESVKMDGGVITGATLAAASNVIEADTVLTIAGLAPDTATTEATQGAITSLGTLTGLTMGGDITLGANSIGRDADNDIDFETDNQITFRTSASDNMILDSSGNLGIGTTTPDSKLDIQGMAKSCSKELTDGATVTVDWDECNTQYVTLGGNRTLAFSNLDDNKLGAKVTFVVSQDGTGTRTLTFPTEVTWGSAGKPTLDVELGATDVMTFFIASSSETIHGRYAD